MRVSSPASEPTPKSVTAFVSELSRHYPITETKTPPRGFAFLLLGIYTSAIGEIDSARAVAMARNFVPRIQEIADRLDISPTRLQWRWDAIQGVYVYVYEE
jgi:hypothetical protein